ncbi:trace amine-associated receptor 6-like [Halichondria panicea]|uniref:trace amine-associated receptor 6-like n=1 Tax=Halichondria panicea TaxID=6063 RepID=UPI00312B9325
MNVSVDNMSSLTCEERRYIGRTTVDFDTEAILRYLLVGYLILLFPFSVCLNGFLIILMATIKSLHQTVYFLALQVVVVDFGLSIFVLPITIANAIAGKWAFDPTFCSLSIFVIHLIRMARYWLMFVFVSDRFASVFFPFSYLQYQKKFVIILSIMAWAISLSFAILPVALDCAMFSRTAFYCTGGNGCTNTNACQSSRLLTITLTNIMGSFVPLVLYIILFLKAKMLQKSIIVPNCDGDDSNHRNNARHNTTFFFLFLALFGVNIIPFFFFIVGNSILSTLSIPPPSQYVITTIIFRSLYNILPLIDAIAIIRNRDFRQAISLFKSKLFG